MKLIDGTKVAKSILQTLRKEVESIKDRRPGIAFVLIGDDMASKTYVRMKRKRCKEIGFISKDFELPASTTQEALSKIVLELNHDPQIDGILIQMPLPSHLNSSYFLSLIDPRKDVDGFHPLNMGYLLLGEHEGYLPCTPYGIYELMQAYNINPEGKHVVIVGRSNIVGKPLAALLMQKFQGTNATVTVAHSKTKNLKEICQKADILIAAIGQKEFIKADFVKDGAIVIDVGMNKSIDKEGNSYLCGDTDFKNISNKCSYITPVPGGVGPMTIAMLLVNTFISYIKKEKNIQPKHLKFHNNILVGF